MDIVVQKYGGSSVGNIDKIKSIAQNVINRMEVNPKIVVVVSAMGDTTDGYINLAKGITQKPNKRELDVLMSTGEMISASLLSMALNDLGCKSISYSAYQLDIQTSGAHGKSSIDDINIQKVQRKLDEGYVVIVTGFQGVNNDGDITTLGRGGSDTSAVALAVKLNAKCEIYTDVDGIYSTDPRKYSEAKKLNEIEYEEMLELASLGAQVMHSRSIELAQKFNTEIYVGQSCSGTKGTYIRGRNMMKLEDKVITGIATSDDDNAITIKDIELVNVCSLFEEIAYRGISVDMISQTAPIEGRTCLSFTVPKDESSECKDVAHNYASADNVFIDEDITKFSLVGLGMKYTAGVASKVFKIFNENNIVIKLITTSEIRITCAINSKDKNVALNNIAKEFKL